MNSNAIKKAIENTKRSMQKAAKELDFISAAQYRDEMFRLQEMLKKKGYFSSMSLFINLTQIYEKKSTF